jgi:hypothetical protein
VKKKKKKERKKEKKRKEREEKNDFNRVMIWLEIYGAIEGIHC